MSKRIRRRIAPIIAGFLAPLTLASSEPPATGSETTQSTEHVRSEIPIIVGDTTLAEIPSASTTIPGDVQTVDAAVAAADSLVADNVGPSGQRLDPLFTKYEFASGTCTMEARTTTIPTFEESVRRVRATTYVENDMDALKNVRDRINEAATFGDARQIAQQYLMSKGVPIVFRGPDQGNFISTPEIDVSFDGVYVSEPWDAGDAEKKAALTRVVTTFAALNRDALNAFDGNKFYVPESIAGAGGYAGVPDGVRVKEFYTVLGLSSFGEESRGVFWHEFFGHGLHARVCGITQYFDADDSLRRIIDSVPDNAPFKFPSDYSKVNGAEYFAEIAADFGEHSLPRPGIPRSDSASNLAMLLHLSRLSEYTGVPIEDLLADAEIARVYGASAHPLESVDSAISPISVYQDTYPGQYENMTSYHVKTRTGEVVLLCWTNKQGETYACASRISGDLLDASQIDTPWWEEVRREIEGSFPVGDFENVLFQFEPKGSLDPFHDDEREVVLQFFNPGKLPEQDSNESVGTAQATTTTTMAPTATISGQSGRRLSNVPVGGTSNIANVTRERITDIAGRDIESVYRSP